MNRTNFIRTMFVNNIKNIAISLSLIFFILFLSYLQITDSSESNQILFNWLGGYAEDSIIYIGLIKISFILILFIQTGKSLEIFDSNFIYSVMSRSGSKIKITVSFMLFVLLLTFTFTFIFHLIYGYISGIYSISSKRIIKLYNIYILTDSLSIMSMITLLVMLELKFHFKNSLLIILTPYMFNLIYPFYNIIAISTSKFGYILSEPSNYKLLYVSSLTSILIMFFSFVIFFKKEGVY